MAVDPIGMALSGFNLIGTFASADTDAKNRMYQAEAQRSQALSDQQTALKNVDILNAQMGMYTTQMGEKISDRRTLGNQDMANQSALVAASGLGGAGSSRSQNAQINRIADRDIKRLTTSMNAQNDIYGLQIEQTQGQADQYGQQASFAQDAYDRANKAKKTWWNPFD